MIDPEVRSDFPPPAPGQITAWIELSSGKSLAAKSTIARHPGHEDFKRRARGGPIGSPYLTASAEPLLYLPGAAAKAYPDSEKVKILAARALATARERRAEHLIFALDSPRGAICAPGVAEGVALAAYRFDKYKKKEEDSPDDPRVTLVVPSKGRARARAEVQASCRLADSVNRARDLVNEPGSVATPAEIESRARALAKTSGLAVTVLDEKQLAKEGYQGLLTVGRAGKVPPRMIVLSYKPRAARAKLHLGLLGKGVTFDTGGVSIKPASKMWEMKGDMAGAAAVLYAMEAIAALKLKLRVTAIVVTAQNYVDTNAVLPGDVMVARNGKSIQIDNTDAEGRLILTDGLWRAGEEEVTHLVDLATLTGSIVRALGTTVAGSFGNDGFVDRVTRVANDSGEPCWKMPLVEEYRELLKCEIADLNNISSRPEGGAITAALFLREFVPEGVSWTHLDIAGPFLLGSRWKYFAPGATGIMVRTLAALAGSMAAKER